MSTTISRHRPDGVLRTLLVVAISQDQYSRRAGADACRYRDRPRFGHRHAR